ncbi:TetR/AcrR family transcriptional regulator [Parachryseolinea silvisoli]|jgi:TetR/AcrR family transcriptional repressor of nem operon|uniref:TetR/AcrR family transcriptional regulator n=1 Tax=Parachryseolinea silvisoli TaxID=2873601 RepID=UPI002265DC74|nr:TetR/AcrR family transcriptional regulator [Parachryseolinea silvisoli]MCD9018075.1 TetR/AcrR family transcriptional regulator [Parachryseolinea silvisoli]
MRDPEATKETILKKSGVLFNTQGYKATSISQITDATGFTKGAIYRHFGSKDDLEKETLAFLSNILFGKLRVIIVNESNAVDKLRGIFKFFESYISNPPLKGGCPLLNAAIEVDDAHPALRKEAVKTLTVLKKSLMTILQNGIDHKQLKPDTDVVFFSTLIIAVLEGGIMMSKLEGNNNDIRKMINHLNDQLKTITL